MKTLLFTLLLAISIAACNSAPEKPAEPKVPAVKETKTGLASYYSRSFEGQETASGETFSNKEMTAAHPEYPLGTICRITNLEKDSAVAEVRISDRGPTKTNQNEGVIIDLSRAAAKQLGMIKDGRVKVKVEVLEWGSDERTDEHEKNK
jgi:rare lipoprotein A